MEKKYVGYENLNKKWQKISTLCNSMRKNEQYKQGMKEMCFLQIGITAMVLLIGLVISTSVATAGNETIKPEQKIGVTNWMEQHDWSNFSNYTKDMNAVVKEDSSQRNLILKDSKGNYIKLKAEEKKNVVKVFPDITTGKVYAKSSYRKISKNYNIKEETYGSSSGPWVYWDYVEFYWYWIKDTSYIVKVDVCNGGDTNADWGYALFYFNDDNKWYLRPYSNLAPHSCQVVEIPVNIDSSVSVGLKPSWVGVTYHCNGYISYLGDHWGDFPYVVVYNDTSLRDPNITLTDSRTTTNDDYALSHFPVYYDKYGFKHYLTKDQLKTLYEAAVAGDNTLTPMATSVALHTYVNRTMKYDENLIDSNIRSDIWIRNHNFTGACKEIASLFNAYSRALRIPSRILIGLDDSFLYSEGHAWCENWNGSDWIQFDPTNNLINNPCFYKNAGYNFRIWWMNEWDDRKDDGDGTNTTDGILSMLYCGDIYCKNGVYSDAKFVYDFGYWAKYNANC